MNQSNTHEPVAFALCIRKGEEDDLEVRKTYPVLASLPNEQGFLRVVDESGEDYLYPAGQFIVLSLSPDAQQALANIP